MPTTGPFIAYSYLIIKKKIFVSNIELDFRIFFTREMPFPKMAKPIGEVMGGMDVDLHSTSGSQSFWIHVALIHKNPTLYIYEINNIRGLGKNNNYIFYYNKSDE